MKSTGWYLALRYMQGTGLVARVAEKIEPARRGAQFIFADRVLCRAENWREVVQDWWDALAPNGHLILWLPDCRHQDLEPGEAKLTLEDVAHALDTRPGWRLCESDLIDGHIYSVWQKHDDQLKSASPWRKRDKHLLIARTGAHGDALMAASILPWLKKQGWTISVISRAAGCEMLRCDPHIDELITLAAGQVSEEELPYYWRAWEKRFDRFINLTHSVEGELLKQPGRGDYAWSDDQRRAQCSRSYLKHLHDLAGVPKPYRVRFYPDAREKFWAQLKAKEFSRHQDRQNPPPLGEGLGEGYKKGSSLHPPPNLPLRLRQVASADTCPRPAVALWRRRARGEGYHRASGTNRSHKSGFILWCLRGSAVHKWWPYAPEAICQLLTKTDVNVVLTGDASAEPLAQDILAAVRKYHGDAKRLHVLAGTHTIREIVTLAHHADVVVGPETGVMNAVSLEAVPKVLLLSHSSPRNLSDDWTMTTALKPTAPCYPCHRLHFNHDWCPQDKATGAAACAASITAEQVVEAVCAALQNKTSAPWWRHDEAHGYAA